MQCGTLFVFLCFLLRSFAERHVYLCLRSARMKMFIFIECLLLVRGYESYFSCWLHIPNILQQREKMEKSLFSRASGCIGIELEKTNTGLFTAFFFLSMMQFNTAKIVQISVFYLQQQNAACSVRALIRKTIQLLLIFGCLVHICTFHKPPCDVIFGLICTFQSSCREG